MTLYDLGDAVPLQHRVYDSTGTLVTATVNLAVTAPDGTVTTPTVTEAATGVYEAMVTTDQLGVWSYRWDASGTVPLDYVSGQFSVVDSAPPAYASAVDLKAMLGISADTTRDALVASALSSASRAIDRRCGRRFYADKTATARTYVLSESTSVRPIRRRDEMIVLVDDISAATGLTVEIGAYGVYSTVDTYDVGPDNALARGEPITQIELYRVFPYAYTSRLRVTAQWGWPAIPDDITLATLLYASRLFRRKDSPEGVAGTTEWGAIRVSARDPDVEALISPYIVGAFA